MSPRDWSAINPDQIVTAEELVVASDGHTSIPAGPAPSVSGDHTLSEPIAVQYARHATFDAFIQVYEDDVPWKSASRPPGSGNETVNFSGPTLGSVYKAEVRRHHDAETFLIATGAGTGAADAFMARGGDVNLWIQQQSGSMESNQIPSRDQIRSAALKQGAFGAMSNEHQYGEPV